jgi:hypothetical protein
MKRMLLGLAGIMLCTSLHSAAATKAGEELHAAVTDMPAIIDMCRTRTPKLGIAYHQPLGSMKWISERNNREG